MPSAHPFTPDLADPRSQRWGDAATGIVCDPQGLTCCTRGQISQQWRWTELARIVALDRQAALGIITRAGDKQRYRDRRLSAADYADIARCAQHFLHPAQTSTPSTATTTLLRCWYQDARSLSGAGSSLFGLFFLAALLTLWLLSEWLRWRPIPLTETRALLHNSLTMLGFAVLCASVPLLLLAARRHYRYHFTPEPRLMAQIDAHGLSIHSPGNITHRLLWPDIRRIRAMRADHFHPEHLLIEDRLGQTRRIFANHLENFAIVADIAACATAVIHGQPLPPPQTANAPPRSNGGKTLLWLNLLLLPFIIIPSFALPLGETGIKILLLLPLLLNALAAIHFAHPRK